MESFASRGSLFEFTRRFSLDPDHPRTRAKLIAATVVFAWLPIVALAAWRWARTGELDPLVIHAEVHARLLGALTLVLLAEFALQRRLDLTVTSVVRDEVLADPPHREAWLRSNRRLSRWHATRQFDRVWLTALYSTVLLAWWGLLPDWTLRWMLSSLHDQHLRSVEGGAVWWYLLVAQPLLLWVFGRWLHQWALWGGLVWRLARSQPKVCAAHVDGVGGLGFLRLPLDSLNPFVFGSGIMLGAVWFDEIAADRATTATFFGDVITYLLLVVALMVLPYLALSPILLQARNLGRVQYTALMRRFLVGFDARWFADRDEPHELLEHVHDISALADLGTSARVVEDMRTLVPSVDDLRAVSILAAIPLLVVGLIHGPSAAELLRGGLTRLLGV